MKEKQIKTIATHDGGFHSDEVFAVAVIRRLYPDAKVIRTRDPELWKTADIRVDVGGAYNPETLDFDHHQKEFTEKNENGIPYSSLGLIWKHFGRKLVKSDEAFENIKEEMVEFMDAQDTGVDYAKGNVQIYGVGHIIDSFNPTWKSKEDANEKFEEAVSFALKILDNEIKRANDYSEGVGIVREAIKKDKEEEFIVLDEVNLPTTPLINETDLLFVISPRSNGDWNSYAIRKKKGSFESRLDFPEEWGGLTGEELEKACGVKGAKFCHKGLFICVADSKEGVVEMTRKAIETSTK